MRHKLIALLTFAALAIASAALPLAGAGNLPEGCTKHRGTVTCTTYEASPPKNQAGLGTTTTKETKGNTTNTSPTPQNLETTSSCKPAKSQGTPCR